MTKRERRRGFLEPSGVEGIEYRRTDPKDLDELIAAAKFAEEKMHWAEWELTHANCDLAAIAGIHNALIKLRKALVPKQ